MVSADTTDGSSRGLLVVAIDGPAGAGKSTVARALARRLGLEYLDTGAMYRAVTYAAVRRNVPVDARDAVAALAREVQLEVTEDGVRVDGEDATTAIRSGEVTALVSTVAANPDVRSELRRRQRDWGLERGGGVIEGRDIGSVVFPDAVLKVFLTATPRVRAERRVAQSGGDLEEIERAIIERDRKDSTRADSPLVAADRSVVIDTTGRTVDEVVDEVVALLQQREQGDPTQ